MSKKKKKARKQEPGTGKGTEKAGKAKKAAETCPGGKDCVEPKKHLCRLAKRGDIETLRELARDAGFICAKCGRSARIAKSLCRPLAL